MKKAKSKKGFTLIELIVVLAILAIVAAVAVPTAFGSLEKAKDAAAIASLESMNSVIRTARIISLADDKFQNEIASVEKGAFLEYLSGAFKRISTGAFSDYEDYMVDAMNGIKLRVDKKAYFFIRLDEGGAKGMFDFLVVYAPDGASKSGVIKPTYSFPYYRYMSSNGKITKFKADGSQEIINR